MAEKLEEISDKWKPRHNSTFNAMPVGVFWDIENCNVPRDKSTLAVVHKIRNKFLDRNHREAEFMCACDVNKESKQIIRELNMAHVTVVHIDASSKNAADEKLKQSMRRFADTHGCPATIILLTSDIDFAGDLSDFKHRRGIRVVLIHNSQAPSSLISCSHEHYNFLELCVDVADRNKPKFDDINAVYDVIITNLPREEKRKQIKQRLKKLSLNSGGKVSVISSSLAVITFANKESALRARKRMDGQNVCGSKISVNFPTQRLASDKNGIIDTSSSNHSSKPVIIKRKVPNSENRHAVSNGDKLSNCKISHQGPPPDLITQDRKSSASQANGSAKDIANNAASSSCTYWMGSEHDIVTYTRYSGSCNDIRNRKFYCQQRSSSVSDNSSHCDEDDAFRYRRNTSSTTYSSPVRYRRVSESDDYSSRRSTPSPTHRQMPLNHMLSQSHPVHRFIPNQVEESKSYRQRPFINVADAKTMSYSCSAVLDVDGRQDQNYDDHSHAKPCSDSFVELRVSNLDPNMDSHQLKKLLFSVFSEHVMVLHVAVVLQPDSNYVARIRIPSMQDAHYAISQLHRRKIGFKRILIAFDSDQNVVPIRILRSEVCSLLMDVPGQHLPLFKFRELFEQRYHRSIGVSELYKLKDMVIIDEDGCGRMVSLNHNYRSTPSPATSSDSSKEVQEIINESFCEMHFKAERATFQGWAERNTSITLPDVCISIKLLSTRLHTLLHSHAAASLPVTSLEMCYQNEFGDFDKPASSSNEDEANYRYVPLEHLVTCVPGVQIVKKPSGVKKIQWAADKQIDRSNEFIHSSPALVSQLTLFSRELVDLLKSNKRCQISFNKFIPAYHHHFGRQCRVADYGYTKLSDLIEAVPHVVQILGDGQKRLLTLTHRAQVKRFTSDLLRVLKSQPNKQMLLSDLPTLYLKCFQKPFNICHYGICYISDILSEIPEGVVIMTETEQGNIISVPRREQTPEEIDRTKQFAAEVIELMRHAPLCRIEFNKFIPAYHHHFGKQCRVADYGFCKLIELFESIPDIIEIHGEGDDKLLKLTEHELLKVLADQIVALIKSFHREHRRLTLSQLPSAFVDLYGYNLKPEDYQAVNYRQLLNKIRHVVKIIDGGDGPVVTLVDRGFVRELSVRVRRILMDQLEGKLPVDKFVSLYKQRYGVECNLTVVKRDLQDVCIVHESGDSRILIRLTLLQVFAQDVHILLHDNAGRMLFSKFDKLYMDRFGVPCRPAQYGKANLTALLQSIPDVVFLRGKGSKKMILLNRETSGMPLSFWSSNRVRSRFIPIRSSSPDYKKTVKDKIDDLMQMPKSPVDFLAQPVPSSVPSPEICPDQFSETQIDLIRFELPSNKHETDDVMSAILNGTLPHIYTTDDGQVGSTYIPTSRTSPMYTVSSSVTPPPNMLPHPTKLLRSQEVETGMTTQYVTNLDSQSCDEFSPYNTSSSSLTDYSPPSCHSMPSRRTYSIPNKRRTKNRIAAQFTIPLDQKLLRSQEVETGMTTQYITNLDSQSCDEFSLYNTSSSSLTDYSPPSCHSTPSRRTYSIPNKRRTKNRIAAQFTIPLDQNWITDRLDNRNV